MEGKLYRVVVEVELYWYSKNGTPPATGDYDLIKSVANMLSMGAANVYASARDSTSDVHIDWLDDCPYGDGGNAKTVREWLS